MSASYTGLLLLEHSYPMNMVKGTQDDFVFREGYHLQWDSPVGQTVESSCSAGDWGSIPGSGRSPGEENEPTPIFLPAKSHEWRSLPGYSPWGHKESNTTEQLHFHHLQ